MDLSGGHGGEPHELLPGKPHERLPGEPHELLPGENMSTVVGAPKSYSGATRGPKQPKQVKQALASLVRKYKGKAIDSAKARVALTLCKATGMVLPKTLVSHYGKVDWKSVRGAAAAKLKAKASKTVVPGMRHTSNQLRGLNQAALERKQKTDKCFIAAVHRWHAKWNKQLGLARWAG